MQGAAMSALRLCLPRGRLRQEHGPVISVFFFMATERTFIAIKPDGVQRGLVGEILGRFERKGFKLVGLKQITPSRELAEQHYGVHKERPSLTEDILYLRYVETKKDSICGMVMKN